VRLDGPLALVGVTSHLSADRLEVETWWQVVQDPITRPLSIMAHLVTEQGQTAQVADGLGISPLDMQAGDVIVQRHIFSNPLPGTKLWLRTGAYWLDTLDRWQVVDAPGADAIFIPLGE
jgi:hypothetical protein